MVIPVMEPCGISPEELTTPGIPRNIPGMLFGILPRINWGLFLRIPFGIALKVRKLWVGLFCLLTLDGVVWPSLIYTVEVFCRLHVCIVFLFIIVFFINLILIVVSCLRFNMYII